MDSRKHWPSLFKSKSSTSLGDQLNETPNSSPIRTPYLEGSQKEKSPPKTRPRWNPKPEQIKILEDIFNSGKLNPTREEIKRIRAQLEEFGQIGDASVFYWFQNRKSRSKQKQRQPQAKPKPKSNAETGSPSSNSVTSTASTSTSVQSKPSGDLVNSIKNNTGDQSSSSSVVPVSSFSGYHYDPQVNERMSNNQLSNMQAPVILNEGTAGVQDSINVNRTITAFINDIPIDFPMGPINFRAFFGDDALLFDSSGQSVLVNEWGFTLQGLEHGAKYFLI